MATEHTQSTGGEVLDKIKKNVMYRSHPALDEAIERYITEALAQKEREVREETVKEVLGVISSKQNQFTSTYERGYQKAVANILLSIKHFFREKYETESLTPPNHEQ